MGVTPSLTLSLSKDPEVPFCPLSRTQPPATIPTMKEIERLYNQMEKLMDALGIPKEIPKGSFYHITDEEKEMNNKKRGGQPGNGNARKHGLYSKQISAEQHDIQSSIKSVRDLSPEIALLRLKIMQLLEDPDTPHADLIKSLNTLTRMVDVQERHLYLVR